MEEYNVKFSVCYTKADTFKKKFCDITTSTINTSRIYSMMNFVGYAQLTFDEVNDHKHEYPKIIMQDKFNRIKTNCLVYDLYDTPFNPGYYDKMFIYHEVYGKVGYFNYYLYNTQTQDFIHITWIEDAFDIFVQRLAKTFNTMRRRVMFDYYGRQHDATKSRLHKDAFGNITIEKNKLEIPTVVDLANMLEYYDTIDLKYANKEVI